MKNDELIELIESGKFEETDGTIYVAELIEALGGQPLTCRPDFDLVITYLAALTVRKLEALPLIVSAAQRTNNVLQKQNAIGSEIWHRLESADDDLHEASTKLGD